MYQNPLKKVTADEASIMERLSIEGLSLRQIATRLERGTSTVRRVLIAEAEKAESE